MRVVALIAVLLVGCERQSLVPAATHRALGAAWMVYASRTPEPPKPSPVKPKPVEPGIVIPPVVDPPKPRPSQPPENRPRYQVLVFGFQGCVGCDRLKGELNSGLNQDRWTFGENGDVWLVQLENEPTLCRDFRVSVYPTTMIVERTPDKLKEVCRLTGTEASRLKAADFLRWINDCTPGGSWK